MTRARTHAALALTVATFFLSGCEGARDGTMCALSPQHRLEQLDRGRYSGLAMLRTQGGLFAIWSRPDGTYSRPLDSAGAPTGPRQRIGSACSGGISVAAGPAGAVLACAMEPRPAQAKPGGIFVFRLSETLSPEGRERIADVGPHGHGVAIAARGDGWVLAWNDAHTGGSRVWRAELGPDLDTRREPTMVSSPRVSAGAPQIYIDGDRTLVTWAETWRRGNRAAGHVVIQDGERLPREVAETRFAFPLPTVGQDERGLFIGFRDVRPPFRKSGLYLQRLTERLRPVGEVERAGRANGRGRPCLEVCGGNLFGASPRTWSRDYIIGVNLFDQRFQQRIRERQVYEFGHRFNDVATTCSGTDLVLLVAEERTLDTPDARLATVSLRCH